ncbi:hypothetical protein K461DRAFT_270159 [Myriangium duriaei CBS 260.36]|uniref:LisH domain-containing protein n=1 Tax=Myriangium duriaei CBS 260.36 TaxID=1168546 RepID=A0A9P4IXP1_9PEZI|nr:hypothetical protein K461DRAFT_270159 [Myriangium duriaei CBS 260.36]
MNNLAAMGGPVGAQQIPNAGTPGSIPAGNGSDNKRRLHTYIYDYFLKNEMFDLARALFKEVDIDTSDKPSPNRKDVNGAPDGMDTDTKGDIPNRPADLPRAAVPGEVDSSFLLDWWMQFWDCWSASRTAKNSPAKQYLQHVQNQRLANDRQRMMANPQMQAMQQRNGMMPNGMPMSNMSNDMKKAMLMQQQQQGGRPPTQAQLNQLRMQQQQQMAQTQMQREGSQMDMNGQPRPQTPGSGEAPSPKRQRLEGGGFNGQMGPMGRGQNPGMAGPQFNGMQMPTPGGPAKPMQVYANQMHQQQMQLAMNSDGQKGMPAGLPVTSPAVDQNGEMFNQNQMRSMAQPGANSSNHALQDYQMQLMLLEQQNKKRLLMARQEQDSQTGPGGPMPGQPGFGAPAMSPSNSRTGPSPNPDEQIKRGTPKMAPGGMPPGMDGMQGRASPAPGFDPSQMNPGMPHNFQGMKMPGAMMGPNGQMMAATSHPAFNAQMAAQMNGQMNGMTPQQMEMMRQQAAAGRPNGPWPQPPPGMMHAGQPQQPPNMTPQQRNSTMPPPPAPATGDNQNRTQPSSPQQNAAPPTPSQTNKPNPKKKDNSKGGKKAAAKKNTNATAATPASEAGDQPPTPTPAPPITPTAPSQQFPKGGPAQGANPPQAAGPQGVVPNQAPQPDMSGPFGGSLDGPDMNFGMDFGNLDGQDVLDNFDFDSFLNAEGGDSAFAFDASMGFGTDPGLEAGGDV